MQNYELKTQKKIAKILKKSFSKCLNIIIKINFHLKKRIIRKTGLTESLARSATPNKSNLYLTFEIPASYSMLSLDLICLKANF
jgi:restriction endonuclease S subunit